MAGPDVTPPGTAPDANTGQAGTLRVLIALAVPALLAISIYAATNHSLEIFAVSALIAACAFALGSLLGFLFGIPQYLAKSGGASTTDKASYEPNTNLTQVSDWLTKIIIGVGLVEFGQLVESLGELGDDLGPSLGGAPTGRPFAIAVVVGFFVTGFLVGYIFTRLRLQGSFTKADRGAFEEALGELVNSKLGAKLDEQNNADAQALKLALRQLDPVAPAPPPEALKEALNDASPPIKEQVLSQARALEKQPAGGTAVPERARVVIETINNPPDRQ